MLRLKLNHTIGSQIKKSRSTGHSINTWELCVISEFSQLFPSSNGLRFYLKPITLTQFPRSSYPIIARPEQKRQSPSSVWHVQVRLDTAPVSLSHLFSRYAVPTPTTDWAEGRSGPFIILLSNDERHYRSETVRGYVCMYVSMTRQASTFRCPLALPQLPAGLPPRPLPETLPDTICSTQIVSFDKVCSLILDFLPCGRPRSSHHITHIDGRFVSQILQYIHKSLCDFFIASHTRCNTIVVWFWRTQITFPIHKCDSCMCQCVHSLLVISQLHAAHSHPLYA